MQEREGGGGRRELSPRHSRKPRSNGRQRVRHRIRGVRHLVVPVPPPLRRVPPLLLVSAGERRRHLRRPHAHRSAAPHLRQQVCVVGPSRGRRRRRQVRRTNSVSRHRCRRRRHLLRLPLRRQLLPQRQRRRLVPQRLHALEPRRLALPHVVQRPQRCLRLTVLLQQTVAGGRDLLLCPPQPCLPPLQLALLLLRHAQLHLQRRVHLLVLRLAARQLRRPVVEPLRRPLVLLLLRSVALLRLLLAVAEVLLPPQHGVLAAVEDIHPLLRRRLERRDLVPLRLHLQQLTLHLLLLRRKLLARRLRLLLQRVEPRLLQRRRVLPLREPSHALVDPHLDLVLRHPQLLLLPRERQRPLRQPLPRVVQTRLQLQHPLLPLLQLPVVSLQLPVLHTQQLLLVVQLLRHTPHLLLARGRVRLPPRHLLLPPRERLRGRRLVALR
eukprot:Rhum_TRINITY_DN9593_c0_g1::Rhum_TRINITY_DN9593_c0_g1_i1::g.34201::m.34201